VQRLSAGGAPSLCFEADADSHPSGLASLASPLLLPTGSLPGGQHHRGQGWAAGDAGAGNSGVDGDAWRLERRLLKAVCKLALAVTMDVVAGKQCVWLVRATGDL
jgi:hypothetical protein